MFNAAPRDALPIPGSSGVPTLAVDHLHYDPLTGIITFLRRHGRSSPGDKVGAFDSDGYLITKVHGVQLKVHRLAWRIAHGDWPQGEIDHINGNRADNRLCNLRVVSKAGNAQNKVKPPSNNRSGFIGVSWRKAHRKWGAAISVGGRSIWIGYFLTAAEAGAAYQSAKSRLHVEAGR